MTNEHIQQLSKLIKKEENRLESAYQKIETGAKFLAELFRGKDEDSVRVREELLRGLTLFSSSVGDTIQLAHAQTTKSEDEANFTLIVGQDKRDKKNPSFYAQLVVYPRNLDEGQKMRLTPDANKSPEDLTKDIMSFIKKGIGVFPITLESRVDFAEQIADEMNSDTLRITIVQDFIAA